MKLKKILQEVQFPFLKNYIATHPEAQKGTATHEDVFELYANELHKAIWNKYHTMSFAKGTAGKFNSGWDVDMDFHSGNIILSHDAISDEDPMPVVVGSKLRGKSVDWISIDYISVTPHWQGHRGIDGSADVVGYDDEKNEVAFDDISVDVYPKWTGDIKKDLKLWEDGARNIIKNIMNKLPKHDASASRD